MHKKRIVASAKKRISLALQGGGSHGAFTWGVLDRLLEEDDVLIEALSGTSAGIVNAVALAQGMCTGGRDAAREALERLWRAVAERAPYPFKSHAAPAGAGTVSPRLSPLLSAYLNATHFLSPGQLNPST